MDCNFTFKCKKKFGHQNKISKKTLTQEHEQHIKFSTRLKEKHCVLSLAVRKGYLIQAYKIQAK